MRTRHRFGCVALLGLLVLGTACGETLETGTAKTPDKHKPTVDGACPVTNASCGVGAFAACVNLQTDATHCGVCDRACSPGIACQTGVCQQTVCVETTSPFVGNPMNSPQDFGHTHSQLLADVNGDGRLDLIEWQINPINALHTFQVSLGQAGGGFAAHDTYEASFGVQDIQATNDNDDSATDLFVFAETSLTDPAAHVEIWLGHPDGHLTRARANDLAGASVDDPAAIALGDVSGDGWADVVTTSDGERRNVNVFLSDSTGALHPTQSFVTAGVGVYGILIRDWNGDGSPDVLVMTGAGLQILYNHGDGTFEPPLSCPVLLPVYGGVTVVAEDFNHDGLIDFALNGNPIRVVLRRSECGFAPLDLYEVPVPKSVPQSMGDSVPGGGVPVMRAADMNGDGQLDLVVAYDLLYQVPLIPGQVVTGETDLVYGDTYLSVLLGKPDGKFQLQDTVVSLGNFTITDLAIGEGTGDHRPDVVASGSDGQIGTWENTCQ